MKALLSAVIVPVILLAIPALVFGVTQIEVYSDASLTQCTLADTSPHVSTIYVSETSHEGATGLRFRIAESAGFTGVWLADASPFVTVGSSRTDLSIGFGICEVNQFTVLTMSYQFFGTSTCSMVSIAPAQGQREPICTYCSFGEWPCSGYVSLHVNCDGSFGCNPVSVEPSTWGRVKSLYRN
jgi:hypothetical protein